MQADILVQYVDAQARAKYLRKSIEDIERKIDRMSDIDYGTVSDTVTCGRKRRKPLGTVRISGYDMIRDQKLRKSLQQRRVLLELQEEELLAILNQTEEFIEGIEDIELRNILSLYYVEGMTWVQVAHTMNSLYRGREYTPESCRKKHERFFKKN